MTPFFGMRAFLFQALFSIPTLAGLGDWSSRYAKFDHLGVDDGLPQNTVYALLQDSRGFLWLGTQSGLARYDGQRFQIYQSENSDLVGRTISVLFEDRDGYLWIGTRGDGLNRYDPRTDRFVHYDARDDTLKSNMITAIGQDSNGYLWIGTENGLESLTSTGEHVGYHDMDQGLPHHHVTSIATDDAGSVWVGTPKGMAWQQEGNIGFTTVVDTTTISGIYDVNALFCNKRDVYIGTTSGLAIYSPGNATGADFFDWAAQDSELLDIRSICEDKRGYIWLGTTQGLWRFHPISRNLLHFPVDRDDLSGQRPPLLVSVMTDRSGIVWAGSEARGAFKLNPYSEVVVHVSPENYPGPGLAPKTVVAFYVDRHGKFWITCDGEGLFRFDPQTGTFPAHFSANDDPMKGPLDNHLWAISEDKRGTFWISSRKGLNRFNPVSGEWKHYMHNPFEARSLGKGACFSALIDDRERIWVGSYKSGLNLLVDEEQGYFDHFQHDPKNDRSLSSDAVLYVGQDRRHRIWVGTFGQGLNLLNQDDTFTRFEHDPENPKSLPENSVGHHFEDVTGRVWFATGDGICYLESDKDFVTFGTEHGLADPITYAITQDDRGYLWVSTNSGISRFDTIREEFENFYLHHNLQSREFNQFSALYNQGLLFFGGVNGFNVIDPNELRPYRFQPDIVVTRFQTFGQHGRADNTTQTDFTISNQEEVLSFQFAALDYLAPDRVRYAYQIEGVQKQRIDLGNISTLTITKPPPGTHRLEVWAANPDGLWSQEPLSVKLKVIPPFWSQPAAFAIYAVLLVLLVLALLRMQQNRLKQERSVNEELRRLDRIKDQFLANVSHELRAPLDGVIGLAESMWHNPSENFSATSRKNLQLIAFEGKRLTSLVNDIIDLSRLKNNDLELNLKPVKLHALVQLVLDVSRPMLGTKNILLRNEVLPNLPPVMADEDRLLQILHNLVNNAIKFTEEGRVCVSATNRPGFGIVVEVKDTGIGISRDKLSLIFRSFGKALTNQAVPQGGTGLGLTISRQLIQLHGGTIEVDTEVSVGSTFRFNLPMARVDLDDAQTIQPSKEEVGSVDVLMDTRPLISTDPAERDASFLIMTVDDEKVNRKVLSNFLKPEGYSLVEALDGREALDLIEGGVRPDLVLMDVMMPHLTGYQTCELLRVKYPMEQMPVIFVTARPQAKDMTYAYQVGGNDFLSKPFSREELLAKVKTHLQLLDVTRNLEERVEDRTRQLNRANETLQAQNRELETLDQIVKQVNIAMEPQEVFENLLKRGFELFPADRGLFWQRDGHDFCPAAAFGYVWEEMEPIRFTREEIEGRYIQSGTCWGDGVYQVAFRDDLPGSDKIRMASSTSLLVMDFYLDGILDGVLVWDSNEKFEAEDVRKLKRYREHAYSAFLKARLLAQVTHKNKQIMDSIIYAEKIQEAILPSIKAMNQNFPGIFVLFQPRDIVSGDFYWHYANDQAAYVAVCDCTGHGIPGALLAMVGQTVLNEIMLAEEIIDPAGILEQVNHILERTLKNQIQGASGGMEISLCRWEKASRKLTYAGVGRPLYHVSGQDLDILKGNRGVLGHRRSNQIYRNYELNPKPGDMVYMASDGYLDQHNSDRLKFGTRRFSETLLEIASFPVDEQKEVLLNRLFQHQRSEHQRDDITVIGLRV